MRVCAGCANRNEATAYTDPENEAILQNSMDAVAALSKEKTIIMIAPRLKTVSHADQIAQLVNIQIELSERDLI